MKEKHIGIRASAQMLYMMRNYVNEFEKANGEISQEDMNELFGRNKKSQDDENI